MAQLQRHPSLRFSVFELASDIGLEALALDGNFDPIAEEDEPEVCTTAVHALLLRFQGMLSLTPKRIIRPRPRPRQSSDALIHLMS